MIGNPQTPITSLYEAVKRASQQKPEVDDNNTTKGAVLPLQAEPDAGRRARTPRARTCCRSSTAACRRATRSCRCPPGTVVVQAERPENFPDDKPFERYFVLRDNPELRGTDIKNPRAELRPDDAASRSSRSSSPTRGASTSRTSRSASPSAARPRQIPGQPVESSFQTFAIVLDREVVSRPVHRLPREPGRHRRPHRRPDLRRLQAPGGAGPRRRAEDRRAADRPEADQRDPGLRDARQAGAATRASSRAPSASRSCCSSCSLFYRLLGAIAGVALLTYAVLFFGADQADPDHAHPARHRRTDPHDRSRGRLEHRHLRAHQGGVTRRADRRCRRSPPATSAASRRSSTRTSSR